MRIELRTLAAAVAATAAAALLLAPAAGASSNPIGCTDNGASSVCQKQGHASLRAEPNVRTPSGSLFGSAWLPGYGRGQLPPLLALD